MSLADDGVAILVCDCGKRLRAPGATPGRVGRCPACGGTLRFPGDEPKPSKTQPKPKAVASTPTAEPKPEKPKRAAAPLPVGAAPPTPDESVLPERAKKIDPKRRAELLDAARQVGHGGVLKVPRKTKFGLKDALLYPIWDFAALSWIGFMPFLIGFPYLAVFYLIPVVLAGGNNAILGPFAFPMVVPFAFSLGYLGQILAEVLRESSAGEIHHPKWPEIEFGALVVSLFQWICGLAIGLSLGAVPAIQFWQRSEVHGIADRLTVAAFVACGLSYGLMSVASLILHGSLLAANPFMVLKAIFRAGLCYWQTVALGIGFSVLGTYAILSINKASGSFLIVPAMWLAWAVVVYGSLVVTRSLGMVCHVRREQIGWFPHRERWGVSMDDVDPTIFRDKDGRNRS